MIEPHPHLLSPLKLSFVQEARSEGVSPETAVYIIRLVGLVNPLELM